MIFKFENKIEKAKFNYVMAIMHINELVRSKEFWKNIPNDKKFTYTLHSTDRLKNLMSSYMRNAEIEITFYRSSWFFRGVVSNVKNNKPNTININTRHRNFTRTSGESIIMDIADKINTICHECVHIADNLNGNMSFGHGDNNPVGKEDSFPYWFGNYARDYFIYYYNDSVQEEMLKRINYVQ
tara:strand:+ start:14007 stop:14555 length:549 start_codon:yes stop_codon:yes gene_type:complete